MTTDPNKASKLAFSSQCLPGSIAEQKEMERMAEFHSNKALRLAAEALKQPEVDAQRHKEYQEDYEANQERIKRNRAARTANRGYPRA